MNDTVKNIYVAGDAPTKIHFIGELLGESSRITLGNLCRKSDVPIEVSHSDEKAGGEARKDRNKIVVLSDKCPNGMVINANISDTDTDWINGKNVGNAELVLFPEVFPYATEPLVNRLGKIEDFLISRSKSKTLADLQFKVIFIRNVVRQVGATDSVDPESSYEELPDKIKEKLLKNFKKSGDLIDFVTYSGTSDLTECFSSSPKMFKTLLALSHKEFRNWSDNLIGFPDDYMLEYRCRFDEVAKINDMREICSFKAVMNSGDIMKSCTRNYMNKRYLAIKDFALEMYKQSIESVCFWDSQKDISNLERELDKVCKNTLRFDGLCFPCPALQADHQSLLVKNKLDTTFATSVSLLEETTIPKILYQYLKNKEEVIRTLLTE